MSNTLFCARGWLLVMGFGCAIGCFTTDDSIIVRILLGVFAIVLLFLFVGSFFPWFVN